MCGDRGLSKDSGERVELLELPCNMWGCDDCRPGKRARVVAQILAGKPRLFLTLTMQVVEGRTPLEACDLMLKGWDRLLKWLRRFHKGKEVEAYWFIEATEQGYPHIHIVLRMPFTPEHKIQEHWIRYTGSYILKIKTITNQLHMARYVAKYLTKAPVRFGTHKILSRTRGYLPADFNEKYEKSALGAPRWELLHEGLWLTRQKLQHNLYVCEWVGRRHQIWYRADCAPDEVWKASGWCAATWEGDKPKLNTVKSIRIETVKPQRRQPCVA